VTVSHALGTGDAEKMNVPEMRKTAVVNCGYVDFDLA